MFSSTITIPISKLGSVFPYRLVIIPRKLFNINYLDFLRNLIQLINPFWIWRITHTHTHVQLSKPINLRCWVNSTLSIVPFGCWLIIGTWRFEIDLLKDNLLGTKLQNQPWVMLDQKSWSIKEKWSTTTTKVHVIN
jgi:hypothetical protein